VSAKLGDTRAICVGTTGESKTLKRDDHEMTKIVPDRENESQDAHSDWYLNGRSQ
jgi:hypothetical protein